MVHASRASCSQADSNGGQQSGWPLAPGLTHSLPASCIHHSRYRPQTMHPSPTNALGRQCWTSGGAVRPCVTSNQPCDCEFCGNGAVVLHERLVYCAIKLSNIFNSCVVNSTIVQDYGTNTTLPIYNRALVRYVSNERLSVPCLAARPKSFPPARYLQEVFVSWCYCRRLCVMFG
jgi:hypothetical protein